MILIKRFDFYECMINNKIENSLDAQFWMFKIEDINNNNEYDVYLFNRRFNNERIDQIKFIIDQKEVIINNFTHALNHNSNNIIKCRLYGYNIHNIQIREIIINNKKADIKQPTVLFKPIKRLKLIDMIRYKRYFPNIEVIPIFMDDYWQCCCGYHNKVQATKCEFCNTSIDKLKRICK
ncbi:MAG: hypothetical protein VB009_01970 [Erysipelotrichaceae bacterium]|nr:hypothetical protein [Erysipelotrichaceae bacterium]